MFQMKRRECIRALAGVAGLGFTNSFASTSAIPFTDGIPSTAGTITDVPGIRVGHFTDKRRPTGCTVILFDNEATAGVDYDGSIPGSTMGVSIQAASTPNPIHGILLTGGGVLGLPAVAGVSRFLQEHKVGFDWDPPGFLTPIVVGSVIGDNSVGDPRIIPDAESAYQACLDASTRPVVEGNVGVGAGATIGKMLKGFQGMKGGIGSASLRLGEVVVGALAVINSVGDIVDWRTGKILAGARRHDGKGFVNIVETLKNQASNKLQSSLWLNDPPFRSTTLVVVATNADINKAAMTKIAMMASIGAGRAINPYHTTGDGDSTFAVSTNKTKSELGVSVIGALAAELVSEAVLRAAKAAKSVDGWPAYCDYHTD